MQLRIGGFISNDFVKARRKFLNDPVTRERLALSSAVSPILSAPVEKEIHGLKGEF